MSATTSLRRGIALSGAAVVLAVGAGLTISAAGADAATNTSLAGTWSVVVVEHSQGGPFTRTGTFTYYQDGTGTVQTSGGFTGDLNWQQSGGSISFTFEHNLPGSGLAYGTESGTISGTTFTSTGTIDTFNSNGDETDSFEGDFTGTLQ